MRLFLALSLTALLVGGLAACGSSPSSGGSGGGSTGADTGGEGGGYPVGAALALTGTLAFIDQPWLQGFELAMDQINSEGGLAGKYPIELSVQDTRSDTAQAAVAAQKLISEGAQFLVLPGDADPGIAGGQVAERAEIPAMSGGSTPTMTEQVGEYMFSAYTGDNYVSTAVAEYALESGYKTVYSIGSPESAYTQKVPEYFAEVFEEGGGEIVGTSSSSMEQQDFGAVITRIKGMSPLPDAIETSLYEPAFPAFIKQLRQAGVDIPVLGNDGIASPTVYELGSSVKGVIVPSAAYPTPGGPLATFYKEVTAKDGKAAANLYSAIGFNVAEILNAAVTNAKSTEPAKVRDAIEVLKEVPGAAWPIAYGPDRLQRLQINILELQGDAEGTVKKLAVIEPNEKIVPEP